MPKKRWRIQYWQKTRIYFILTSLKEAWICNYLRHEGSPDVCCASRRAYDISFTPTMRMGGTWPTLWPSQHFFAFVNPEIRRAFRNRQVTLNTETQKKRTFHRIRGVQICSARHLVYTRFRSQELAEAERVSPSMSSRHQNQQTHFTVKLNFALERCKRIVKWHLSSPIVEQMYIRTYIHTPVLQHMHYTRFRYMYVCWNRNL